MVMERQTYQYCSLAHEDSLRLLKLVPAKFSPTDELYCELVERRLSRQPDYEAISYVWGSPVFSEALFLSSERLKITENLASALRRFRDPDSPRLLWADAVCINQNDPIEKSAQVAMMGEIYRSARRVLGWLGTGDVHTPYNFELIHQMAADQPSPGHEDEWYAELQPASDSKHWDTNLTELAPGIDFDALHALLGNTWFTRRWIVQEVVLSTETLLVCGNQEISFHDFTKAMYVLWQIYVEKIPVKGMSLTKMKFARTLTSTRDLFYDRKSLTESLEPATAEQKRMLDYVKSAESHCSDDRDRIYALMSLRGKNDVRVVPDYTKTVSEVYTNFARQCVKNGDIRILHSAGISRNPSQPSHQPSLPSSASESHHATVPSWVPDWRKDLDYNELGGRMVNGFTANHGLALKASTDDGSVAILISGVILDKIELSQDFGLPTNAELSDILSPSSGLYLRDCVLDAMTLYGNHARVGRETYPDGETRTMAFARTMVGDGQHLRFKYNFASWNMDDKRALKLVLLCNMFQHTHFNDDDAIDLDEEARIPDANSETGFQSAEDAGQTLWDYMESLYHVLMGRQFFITPKGYIAPASATSADVVAIFAGADTPFILRPCREETNSFRVVGECYLHGFMYGELLDGTYKKAVQQIELV